MMSGLVGDASSLSGSTAKLAHVRRRRSISSFTPILTILVALVLWELVAHSGAFTSDSIPSMVDTVSEFISLLGQTSFWNALGETLLGWGLGLGIAALLATPLGVLTGSVYLVRRALRVPIEFLRPIPSVALVPLAILIYGAGLESKVFLAAFACFWPILVQTLYGIENVDNVAIDTARAFGLGRTARLVRVRLPSAVPYIATGVRIASAVSLILVITAELVIGSPGLGREINQARSGGALTQMYAYVLAVGILGWGLNAVTVWGENRTMRWDAGHRRAEA